MGGWKLNKKLSRVLDDIQKTEEKIAVWQEHLRELNILRDQLEEKEIVKSFRSLKLEGRQMLEILEGIQNGTIPLINAGEDYLPGEAGETEAKEPETAEERQVPEDMAPEREAMNHEET